MNKKFLKTTTILCGIALLGGNALAASVWKVSDDGTKVTQVSVSRKVDGSLDLTKSHHSEGEGSVTKDVKFTNNKDGTVTANGSVEATEVTEVGDRYYTVEKEVVVPTNEITDTIQNIRAHKNR